MQGISVVSKESSIAHHTATVASLLNIRLRMSKVWGSIASAAGYPVAIQWVQALPWSSAWLICGEMLGKWVTLTQP